MKFHTIFYNVHCKKMSLEVNEREALLHKIFLKFPTNMRYDFTVKFFYSSNIFVSSGKSITIFISGIYILR